MVNRNKTPIRINVANVIKLFFIIVLAILFLYRLDDAFDNMNGIKKFYTDSGDGWFFLLAPYFMIILEMIAVFQKARIAIAMSIISIMTSIVIFLYENMIIFAKLVNMGRSHDIGAKPASTFILCVISIVVIAFKAADMRAEKNKKINKNQNQNLK